jgi:hypothetical protein
LGATSEFSNQAQLGDTPRAQDCPTPSRTGRGEHLAIERPEGGLRYLDAWETQQDCDRFTDERLHPVIHDLLREIFGDELPPEPERTPLSLVHAWGSAIA